jgi:NADPH-dependent 2,4-dienoyl-CoA reductase/sulfur reductase-like enzyme
LIAGKKIRLSAGAELQCGHLVLSVGARNRELRLPHEEGVQGLIFILALRSRASNEAGGGRYTIALAQEKKIETDLVVVGIGVNPNTELLASAGLVVNGGILVDQKLSTSDANISPIGDCVAFPTPHATKPVGIKSVQNATDQARCPAVRLVGKRAPYRSLPWFCSDQGNDKLQIAGLTHDADQTVLRVFTRDWLILGILLCW